MNHIVQGIERLSCTHVMSPFHALVKFTSDTKIFFSPVKAGKDGKLEQPMLGDTVIAYDSVDDLQAGANSSKQKIKKVGDSCDCFPENLSLIHI